jgi:hypothetical protein
MKIPFVAAREVMSDQIWKRVVWDVQPGFFAMISLVTLVLLLSLVFVVDEGDVSA